MKLAQILIVYTQPRNTEQKKTLETVKKALRRHGIAFKLADRNRLKKSQFKNKNLIIAVGGDGTFLRAAHFIGSQLIFGANSDVKDKEGFFMKADRKNFESKFKKIINGRFTVKKLPRLEARINGRKSDTLALNEFFIGPRKSYHAAKYTIMIGKKRERQKSSGILITTPTGSHAWAKSYHGKTLPLNSTGYQYVVREPYQGKVFKNYKLKHGILKRTRKITIVSEMLDGILVADSVSREYRFKNRSKATIKISNKHLNAIWL